MGPNELFTGFHNALQQNFVTEQTMSGWVWQFRYDELKDVSENIDLQTTILSRFDLIFLVKDERNSTRDIQIAKYAGTPLLIRQPSCFGAFLLFR
jgi:hypothetical protein